jgi:hypothetical protein
MKRINGKSYKSRRPHKRTPSKMKYGIHQFKNKLITTILIIIIIIIKIIIYLIIITIIIIIYLIITIIIMTMIIIKIITTSKPIGNR